MEISSELQKHCEEVIKKKLEEENKCYKCLWSFFVELHKAGLLIGTEDKPFPKKT